MRELIKSASTCEANIVEVFGLSDLILFCKIKTKHALRNNDSFAGVAKYVFEQLYCNYPGITWHVTCFYEYGGQSLVNPSKYIKMKFGNVFIEIFCT